MAAPADGPTELPRAGYLGPEGTFSEEALLGSARAGALEPVGLASIYDTVMALRAGELDWAVVPIENSLEGSISATLDLLAGEASDVEIVGEALLRVRHSLIASGPVELSEIETVLTHPAGAGTVLALPAHRAAPRDGAAGELDGGGGAGPWPAIRGPGRAAIGTVLAARIYGGTIVRDGVQDRDDNETRFVWLARTGEQREAPLEADRRLGVADLAAVLGQRRGALRLARALPAGVRRARHQPDQDRVPAPPRGARQLRVLRRPGRPRERSRGCWRRSPGSGRSAKRCG